MLYTKCMHISQETSLPLRHLNWFVSFQSSRIMNKSTEEQLGPATETDLQIFKELGGTISHIFGQLRWDKLTHLSLAHGSEWI